MGASVLLAAQLLAGPHRLRGSRWQRLVPRILQSSTPIRQWGQEGARQSFCMSPTADGLQLGMGVSPILGSAVL